MTRKTFLALLLLLTACKSQQAQQLTPAQQAALNYVKVMQVALVNVYYDHGNQAIPATSCNNPIFGMRKPPSITEVDLCAAKMDDVQSQIVAAKFKDGTAVLADVNGVRLVKPEELPEIK